MSTEQTTQPRTFESKPCTRCGGSGHYSYNALDGTMCYGCRGKGVQFTKRGAAAREFFLNSLVRRYDEVQAGWRIFDRGAGWRTVTSVEIGEFGGTYQNYDTPEQVLIPNTHQINTQKVAFVGRADATMTAYADRAERDAKLAAAFAYEDSLTQQGKPRKR
jgi:hypothetical protein